MIRRVLEDMLLHLKEWKGNKIKLFAGRSTSHRNDKPESNKCCFSRARFLSLAAARREHRFRNQTCVVENWIIDLILKSFKTGQKLGSKSPFLLSCDSRL